MAWLMFLGSIFVLWVASLLKIIHVTYTGSKSGFLKSDDHRNVLLVIAHPDDESMFFTPTINYLISLGHNLHILCLSNGNADGLGDTRNRELYQACAVLKIPLNQVKVLDHPDLQDGFGNVWNRDLVAKVIKEDVVSHAIDLIITFDNYGVSGHCNHRDLNHGIRRFLNDTSVEAWELVSTNMLRKYSGPFDIWLSHLSARGETHCLLNEKPFKTYLAMAQHSSQWLWFRKLFVFFSSYSYVNVLKKINN
ncbi:N-acetylglucosaminyl-phosphatidylinositol de-N-acetylase-like [Impatiens glandulifera]|uniref:N-acetylglucosaminyl-phosphatidylinositol de-N-acetylase-like n=1 Tax=Impatiens glandulifera TaxID=253017 RepID=UPI001FB0B5C0|nr:N-acetylglucosaminyl-phosphatidylinositol de-N-acetylase-like [Impatiens glandulifera]